MAARCSRITSLGVYVVGAVDAAERARIEAHVATCPECHDELVRLLPLRRLLASLTPRELDADDRVRG